MEGTLGIILPVAFNYAPPNWRTCDGTHLIVAEYPDLFAVIGYQYGGSGGIFFLPDLRGRVALGSGAGINGAPTVTPGQVAGNETTSLTSSNLPPHNHSGSVQITPRVGTSSDSPTPGTCYSGPTTNGYSTSPTSGQAMRAMSITNGTISQTGQSYPFPCLSPFVTLNYIICVSTTEG